MFLADPPTNLDDYYPPAYYALAEADDLDTRFAAERYKVALVRHFQPRGRLLEIGTGTGGFLYLAAQAGFAVEAIEQDQRAADWVARRIGCPVTVSTSPAHAVQGLGTFDVVSLWHSLEHMDEPWVVVDALCESLRPNGIIVIATPNPDAVQFRVLRSRWAHVDAPRHSVLIPIPALEGRLRMHGLRREVRTTTDEGGTGWNRFGWQVSLREMTERRAASVFLRRLGRVVHLVMRPIEQTGTRGSTYTLVFRNEP